MSGYRASYRCQDVLLYFINICKKVLDDGDVCMSLLTDLSKAFDCLPYRLLICKLRAYGLSVNACELLKSYFCERKQILKLGDKYSEWLGSLKGVPQGSLMGPFIFNIFLSDQNGSDITFTFSYYWRRHVMFLFMLTIQVFYANREIMLLRIMICYQRLANSEKFLLETTARTLQLNRNVTI